MKEGDIVITPLPQSDGRIKNRPALILKEMPSFGDYLVWGITSQLHHEIKNFDELIISTDNDFVQSGLLADSLIRLGFLAILNKKRIAGSIGNISDERHKRLVNSLADYLLYKET